MPSVKKDTTIKEYQAFVKEVYGLPNDKHFSSSDMLTHIQRFLMRGLKGIRKGSLEKMNKNLLVAFSWNISLLNRFHIDLEEEVWPRFPAMCSYCASRPCACKAKKVSQRQTVEIDNSKRPKTLEDFQIMFRGIYPPETRTIEHAGIHLAEEIGEFAEAILAYRANRDEKDFEEVRLEAADFFSCIMGVYNSSDLNLAEEMSKYYSENCPKCSKAPCKCSLSDILKFKAQV